MGDGKSESHRGAAYAIAMADDYGVRPDSALTKAFILAWLPQFDEMLALVEKDNGWLRLPKAIVEGAKQLNIANWPEVFIDEARFRSMQWRLFVSVITDGIADAAGNEEMLTPVLRAIDVDEFMALDEGARVRELVSRLNKASQEDQAAFLNDLVEQLTKATGEPLEEPTAEQREAERRRFEALDEKAKAAEIRNIQVCCLAFATAFLNYMALITHGQKLTDLVRRAIDGDDAAFLMAVQVDKTLLTHLPQFRERYWCAVLEGDWNFLELLSYRIRNPTIRGRNRYHTLWMLFAMLDDLSLLDRGVTNEAILDLYKAIPEKHVCKPIDDVDYVRKQRAAYLRMKRQTK